MEDKTMEKAILYIMFEMVKNMDIEQFKIFIKLDKDYKEAEFQSKNILLDFLDIVKDKEGCEEKEAIIYRELQKTVDNERVLKEK